MAIRVLFFASLAELTGLRETTIEAAGIPDIGAVFSRFARQFPALEARRSATLFALNADYARPETPVHDGDEVAFFPPVSGG